MSVRTCAPGSPTATEVERPSRTAELVGRYVAEDGGEVAVTRVGDTLRLAFGPMTFKLAPCSDGTFGTKERDLTITFTAEGLTVSEQGRIVARAKRGEPARTVIKAQGAALPNWLDANVPALLSRYGVPAAAVAYISDGRLRSRASTASAVEVRRRAPIRCSMLHRSANQLPPRSCFGSLQPGGSTCADGARLGRPGSRGRSERVASP